MPQDAEQRAAAPRAPMMGRAIGTATILTGAAMAFTPMRSLRAFGAASEGLSSNWVRLLGGRYLVQGAAEAAHPSALVLWGSCVADVLHAATMTWAVAAGVPYRRAAGVSTALATASAASLAFAASRAASGRHRALA